METYPMWLQVTLVIIVADLVPTAIIFTLFRFKRFPMVIKNIILVVGVIAIDRLNGIMPVLKQVHAISDYVFGTCVIIFLIWAIKNKWLWDKID